MPLICLRHLQCALTLAVTLSFASPVLAQSPYELKLEVDLPLILLGLAGTSIALIDVPPPSCLPDCDASRINAFDRTALGNYSETSYTISTAGVYALLAAAPIWDLIETGGNGWVENSAVFFETIVLVQAITQLTKVAVRRPAPFVYDNDLPVEMRAQNPHASRSFISGHTATAFAASTAFTTLYWLRHPDDDWRWAVLIGGALLSSAVSLLKVDAGYHYWTDLLAGAAVGIAMGVLVPVLHQ